MLYIIIIPVSGDITVVKKGYVIFRHSILHFPIILINSNSEVVTSICNRNWYLEHDIIYILL